MSKVTFTAETLVLIDAAGEERGPGMIADDGGLLHRLMGWMNDAEIDWRPRRSGGGRLVCLVPPEDAPRVKAWLVEHGAKERRAR